MAKLSAFAAAVLLYLVLCLSLGGCAGSRPRPGEPAQLVAFPPTEVPAPTLAHRLRALLPVGRRADSVVVTGPAPRKCKGCTIVYGTATVAGKKATVATQGSTASAIGKNKAAVVVASDSATVVDQRGTSQAAANLGRGSSSSQVQAEPKKTWMDYLLAPLGRAIAIVFVVVLFLLLLVAWLRRRARNA